MSVDPSRIRTVYVAVDANGVIADRAGAKDNLQDAIDWIDELTATSDPSSSPWSVAALYDIAPE